MNARVMVPTKPMTAVEPARHSRLGGGGSSAIRRSSKSAELETGFLLSRERDSTSRSEFPHFLRRHKALKFTRGHTRVSLKYFMERSSGVYDHSTHFMFMSACSLA